MSKYCTRCGFELADDEIFCGSCGAKQKAAKAPAEVPAEASAESKNETEEIITAPSPEPDSFATAAGKPKHGRKPLVLAVCGIAVVFLAIFLFDNSKGLIALDEVEQKLNEAYDKLWGDSADDFEGVTEFEIQDADKETYDSLFTCSVPLFGSQAASVGCPSIMGRIKDGQVVQLKAYVMMTEDEFYRLSADNLAAIMAMLASPAAIFKEDIRTVSELYGFLASMEEVNIDGNSGPLEMRIVDGDIEYTYMCGSGSGIGKAEFTIRYLPAFSGGVFEEY